MARSSVYIGIDLQPELLRFVVIDRRGRPVMSGERAVAGDGHSWSNEFATLLQNDNDAATEAKVEEAKHIWGFAPSFASGVCRSIFLPSEARPVADYVAWEASLYLGEAADRFLLSWEMGSVVPGGNLLHTLAVRRQEFAGFTAGLDAVGVRPALIEGRLFSGWNLLSRRHRSKTPLPATLMLLEEGELIRVGYFENGALLYHGLESSDLETLPSRLKEFLQRTTAQPAEVHHQVKGLCGEEASQRLSEELTLPVNALPSDQLDPSFAIALSAALRCKEVAS